MTSATPTTSTAPRVIDLGDGLSVTITENGAVAADRAAVLLLHGGAGPATMGPLAAALSEHAYVITPTHPGFNGTPRPDWFDRVADLAAAYLDLIERLELTGGVLVIGNSVGGWIASEMALRDIRSRISALILLNATGIDPDDPADIVDVRTIDPVRLGELAFHNPALRPNPAALPEPARAAMAANQAALAVYGGELFTHDAKLRRRLRLVDVPVLVVWGEHDGVVNSAYGRAYAAAFHNGRFVPVTAAGHFPQVEQPGQTIAAIGDFVRTEVRR